jgi:hypothetical protein
MIRVDHLFGVVVGGATVWGREKEDLMGFVKTLVKGAVVAKLLQVAQRELSKPENQRKAKEMFQKVQQRRNAH